MTNKKLIFIIFCLNYYFGIIFSQTDYSKRLAQLLKFYPGGNMFIRIYSLAICIVPTFRHEIFCCVSWLLCVCSRQYVWCNKLWSEYFICCHRIIYILFSLLRLCKNIYNIIISAISNTHRPPSIYIVRRRQ